MGLPKPSSMAEMQTASEPTKLVDAPEKLPEDSAMDISGDSRFSSTSLIADGEVDDSMFSSFVVDEDSKVVGAVEKETKKTRVGISLRKSEAANCVIIASIREGGLFSATALKPGQKILSINGTTCPAEIIDAARIIAETIGTVTIEAADLKKDEGPGMLLDEPDDAKAELEDEALLPSAPPAEIDTPSDNKLSNAQNEYDTMKYIWGLALATGTVLIGSYVARSKFGSR